MRRDRRERPGGRAPWALAGTTGLGRAAALLAAASLLGCTRPQDICHGTRLDLAAGSYCVLDPDGGTTICPDGYWFQREVGGAIVCGRERIRPEALPPEVCEALPDGCPAGLDGGAPPPADATGPALDGAPRDAGLDAAGSEPCRHRLPPERPAGTDDGSGGERAYALTEIDLGRGLRWIELGYDLDGRCTEATSTDVECEVDPAVGAIPDPDGGVDNTFGSRLIPLLALAAPDLENQVRMRLRDGHEGVLVRVTGWNGRADDPQVVVAVLEGPVGGGAGSNLLDGGVPEPLAQDGEDEWLVGTGSLAGGDLSRPLVEDTAAYVTDGTLVARFAAGLTLRFTTGSQRVRLDGGVDAGLPDGRAPLVMTIQLRRALLTARIDAAGLSDGILAGRWAMRDVLGMLPALGVCDMDGGPYRLAESEFRHALDLTSDGVARAAERCDALSVGIGVGAVAAHLAGVTPSGEPFDHCTGR